jgi:hypothetical protein
MDMMDPYLFALQIVRSYSKCLNLVQPICIGFS